MDSTERTIFEPHSRAWVIVASLHPRLFHDNFQNTPKEQASGPRSTRSTAVSVLWRRAWCKFGNQRALPAEHESSKGLERCGVEDCCSSQSCCCAQSARRTKLPMSARMQPQGPWHLRHPLLFPSEGMRPKCAQPLSPLRCGRQFSTAPEQTLFHRVLARVHS